jgi:hypothetical protein
MRYIIAFLLLALPVAAHSHESSIPHSELALGGISIDASEQQVRTRLGEPLSITREIDHLNLHLHYADLTVSFSGEVVGRLRSESNRACTPAGLCPGDALGRAVDLYGEPELVEREGGITYWEYYTEFPCWLQLVPDESRIGSIRAVCQP